jgi:hypothetical protein
LAKAWESPALKSVPMLFKPEVPWHSYDQMWIQSSSVFKADGNPGRWSDTCTVPLPILPISLQKCYLAVPTSSPSMPHSHTMCHPSSMYNPTHYVSHLAATGQHGR